MTVSAAMLQRMTSNIDRIVKKIQSRPVPEHIFHYTDGPGFIGVIGNKCLWATHIAFTNDSKEYFGASELVQSKIDAHLGSIAITPIQKRVLAAIQNNLGHSVDNMYHCFVTCFSESKDDLAQWRGYSGKEGKYKIAFDIPHLAGLANELSKRRSVHSLLPEHICYLMPVIYKQTEKDALLDEVISFILQHYPIDEAAINPKNKDDFAHNWALKYVQTAMILAPLVKDAGFIQEAEWRLVIVPTTDKHVKYRSRGALLTPYVEIDLKLSPEIAGWAYPLREVWIGPSAHMDLNQHSAEHLLRQKEVRATFKQSSIPYRDI